MKTPILVLLSLYFGFAVGAAERNPPSAQEVIIDWGMRDLSTFVLRVDDKVDLELGLTGIIC
ncbi:MAG TPA: hypothetical protein VGX93_01975 [Chthoniobacterales bacterium]|jgi:hypothetical protein|nr:hypothetical protein [Chthoniobacterales bacterium]